MAVFIFIFSKLHHLSPDIKTNVPTQCLGWYQSRIKVERGVRRNLGNVVSGVCRISAGFYKLPNKPAHPVQPAVKIFAKTWPRILGPKKPDPEYWDPKNWPRILSPKKGKLRPAPQYWNQIACPRREYCNPKTCPRILRSKIETKKAPKILRPKKGRRISRPNSI